MSKRRLPNRNTLLGALASVVGLGGGGYWWSQQGFDSTDDAQIDAEGHVAIRGSRAAGRATEHRLERPSDNQGEWAAIGAIEQRFEPA